MTEPNMLTRLRDQLRTFEADKVSLSNRETETQATLVQSEHTINQTAETGRNQAHERLNNVEAQIGSRFAQAVSEANSAQQKLESQISSLSASSRTAYQSVRSAVATDPDLSSAVELPNQPAPAADRKNINAQPAAALQASRNQVISLEADIQQLTSELKGVRKDEAGAAAKLAQRQREAAKRLHATEDETRQRRQQAISEADQRLQVTTDEANKLQREAEAAVDGTKRMLNAKVPFLYRRIAFPKPDEYTPDGETSEHEPLTMLNSSHDLTIGLNQKLDADTDLLLKVRSRKRLLTIVALVAIALAAIIIYTSVIIPFSHIYEAENAQLSGGAAEIFCDVTPCSNGYRVTNLSNASGGGSVSFHVNVPRDGNYKMEVGFVTSGVTSIDYIIYGPSYNGGGGTITVDPSFNASIPTAIVETRSIYLTSGDNVITFGSDASNGFGNTTDPAPDIDYIKISNLSPILPIP